MQEAGRASDPQRVARRSPPMSLQENGIRYPLSVPTAGERRRPRLSRSFNLDGNEMTGGPS